MRFAKNFLESTPPTLESRDFSPEQIKCSRPSLRTALFPNPYSSLPVCRSFSEWILGSFVKNHIDSKFPLTANLTSQEVHSLCVYQTPWRIFLCIDAGNCWCTQTLKTHGFSPSQLQSPGRSDKKEMWCDCGSTKTHGHSCSWASTHKDMSIEHQQ